MTFQSVMLSTTNNIILCNNRLTSCTHLGNACRAVLLANKTLLECLGVSYLNVEYF